MPTVFHVTLDGVALSTTSADTVKPTIVHEDAIVQKAEFHRVETFNTLPPGYREPLRKHDDADETIVLLAGACVLVTTMGAAYPLEVEDIVHVDRGVLHALHTDEHSARIFGYRIAYTPTCLFDYG
ncbi:cupin domain-containing protein [Candidatus Parcubacteria bacterium]|nr:MAG: cupin domain-containing protein [Candidatus Parcubacteria bacterium]